MFYDSLITLVHHILTYFYTTYVHNYFDLYVIMYLMVRILYLFEDESCKPQPNPNGALSAKIPH